MPSVYPTDGSSAIGSTPNVGTSFQAIGSFAMFMPFAATLRFQAAFGDPTANGAAANPSARLFSIYRNGSTLVDAHAGAQVGAVTGLYEYQHAFTTANGWTSGDSFSVYVTATVGGVNIHGLIAQGILGRVSLESTGLDYISTTEVQPGSASTFRDRIISFLSKLQNPRKRNLLTGVVTWRNKTDSANLGQHSVTRTGSELQIGGDANP